MLTKSLKLWIFQYKGVKNDYFRRRRQKAGGGCKNGARKLVWCAKHLQGVYFDLIHQPYWYLRRLWKNRFLKFWDFCHFWLFLLYFKGGTWIVTKVDRSVKNTNKLISASFEDNLLVFGAKDIYILQKFRKSTFGQHLGNTCCLNIALRITQKVNFCEFLT